MQQQEIQSFLESFFTATGCQIEKNLPGELTVQLTIDMDKALMNRPFYWHYIEKTGGIPNPMKLTLFTNFSKKGKKKGEWIHFGSNRLHQIFKTARQMGSYIRLYEKARGGKSRQIPLVPWLCLNMKISYQCHLKKDHYRSIGLNLINGAMMENFHQEVSKIKNQLSPKIPDFCFTLSPLIKVPSGLRRIEQFIIKGIEQEEHQWAEEARKKWQEDINLLEKFYENDVEKTVNYFNEMKAIQEQYEPKINISIINGGIFYLTRERFFHV